MRKRILILLMCIVIMIPMLASCSFGNMIRDRRQEINVIDGALVKFEGINGYGKAKITGQFTWHDMFISILQLDPERYSSNLVIENIKSKVTYSISSSEDLSNGDTITITAKYNNEDVENMESNSQGHRRTLLLRVLRIYRM